jgi:hypothetical protein
MVTQRHYSKGHAFLESFDSPHDSNHEPWFSNAWNMLPHDLANEPRKEKTLFLNDDGTNPESNDQILKQADQPLPKDDTQTSGGYF